MSNAQPNPVQSAPNDADRYAKALHITALGGLIVCPALALLPPRKLDFYTVGLITGTTWSANILIRERTGRSIWQHLSPRLAQQPLAPQHAAVSAMEQAKLHRELNSVTAEMQRLGKSAPSVTEEVASQREAWKMQREKEIKDDLEDGKGLGDMIYDQIWEVWNWGKPKEDEDDG